MIVVDVNVIAYLLLDGDRTAESEALLRHDAEWAAPVLWRSEFRSVLLKYLRTGRLELAVAVELSAGAPALLRAGEHVPDHATVLELAAGSTASAYDCEYVALAVALGVPLATSDRALLRAFRGIARPPASFV